MLYLSFFPAAVLLALAHTAARPAPHPIRWVLFLTAGAVAAVLPGCGLFFFPPAVLLYLLLAVGLGVWAVGRRRLRRFYPLSTAAVVIAYGAASWLATSDLRRLDRLREKYPVEALAGRVPEPSAANRSGPLPESVNRRLVEFEAAVETGHFTAGRRHSLRSLHENTVDHFVNSPGFGVARMIPLDELMLAPEKRDDPPPQPGTPLPTGGVIGDPVPPEDRDHYADMHAGGLLDFVNPRGFGYVRAGRRAAGFQPHGFSKVPGPAHDWEVGRVELVGLLRHAEPVVYVTAKLPAMKDSADAPTRPPDAFEVAGLAAVRGGDEVYAAKADGLVRVVGAIRSTKACVACHGGERGDLLGAFSYVLRPAVGLR